MSRVIEEVNTAMLALDLTDILARILEATPEDCPRRADLERAEEMARYAQAILEDVPRMRFENHELNRRLVAAHHSTSSIRHRLVQAQDEASRWCQRATAAQCDAEAWKAAAEGQRAGLDVPAGGNIK